MRIEKAEVLKAGHETINHSVYPESIFEDFKPIKVAVNQEWNPAKRIGEGVVFWDKDKGMLCIKDLNISDKIRINNGMQLAPSVAIIKSHNEGKTRIIDEFKLNSVSLTAIHSQGRLIKPLL